jgi:Zn-dependent peptidase ImmA (M78 family)/DNA-binding XRE family transcriptional regulator
MNQLFADRFKSARLLNGLSLQDLANKLDNKVTRQALYRYERGEVLPGSEMLSLLCEALNVKSDFFFRSTQIHLEDIEFRKLKISAKEETRIVEETRDFLSRYLELEEVLGINEAFQHPLADFSNINSFDQVNAAAQQVRERWKLGEAPLANVAELLEDKGVKIVCIRADKAFDGLQTFANKEIPVIAYNETHVNKPDRIRFTLLHELGHLLLDFSNELSHTQKERFCHQFAGAILLPENILYKEIGKHRNRLDLHELGHIKKQYGISMQAIVMRANALGIVTNHFTKQFFDLFTEKGWRINEPIDYNGIEGSGRFDQLIYRALIEELISTSKAAALKNVSVAEFRKLQRKLE